MNQKEQSDHLFNEVRHLIKHGDMSAIRNLLDEGMSPNLANKWGWTILILAAEEGNTALGELLISRGADVNLPTANTDQPITALESAIMSGRIRFAKLLLDKGAIPGPSIEGWLHWAPFSPKQAETLLAMVRAAREKRAT